MSNNLFSSKNLWIDSKTATALGVNSHDTVYINGDKVSVQNLYSNSVEFSIPLFALRAEQLFKLLSTNKIDAFNFRVFSNFEENISRLFSYEYKSIELLSNSNKILEDGREMNEERRINIFYENNEISSNELPKSVSNKLKKLADKKKSLEEKIFQLKLELKQILFGGMAHSGKPINLDDSSSDTFNNKQEEIAAEKTKVEEYQMPSDEVINAEDGDDIAILDSNEEPKVNDLNLDESTLTMNDQENTQNSEAIEMNVNLENIDIEKGIDTEEDIEIENDEIKPIKSNDVKVNMAVEEEIVVEEPKITSEYESQSISNIDRTKYSKEAIKVENKIFKLEERISKIRNKITALVGEQAKTDDQFRELYNKASAEFENIKAKTKIAERESVEEFNRVKPYLVAELHSLVFKCYQVMCEANVVFDPSAEMFAKLILLMKRNLSMFDNTNEE